MKVIPALLAALQCSFSASGHPVRFMPVDEVFYGISLDGTALHDFRLIVNAELSTSRKFTRQEFTIALENAVATASSLNPRVAKFLHLAFQEKDKLKKFLNFFLSIEIETHAVFKSLDHNKFMDQFITCPSDTLNETAIAFFEAQHDKLKSLKERFVWCVMCVWTHLSDADVATFSRLKTIRDDIAHGNISSVPEGAEADAERLVIKMRNPR